MQSFKAEVIVPKGGEKPEKLGMTTVELEIGDVLRIGGRNYIIMRRIPGGKLLLRPIRGEV